jgi:hypothetical protein
MNATVEAAKNVRDAADTALKSAFNHWTSCVKQAAADLGDPSKTSSDADPLKELQEASSEIEDAGYEAFKANLKLYMTEAGADAEQVEEWIENHAKEIWDKAQQLRSARNTAARIAKFAHRVKVGVVTGLFSFLGIVFVAQKYDNYKHGDAKTALDNNIYRWQAEREMDDQLAQFDTLTSNMQAPALPDLSRYDDPTEAAKAAIPQEITAALPAPVAAIAIQPVRITLKTQTAQGEKSRTVTSTMAQVYYYGDSETRNYIESKASEPQTKPYVYAFQEPGSCTQRDCLGHSGGISGSNRWDGRPGKGGLKGEQH